MKPKFDINDDYDWVFNLIAFIAVVLIGVIFLSIIASVV
jgi:hypothetical protein